MVLGPPGPRSLRLTLVGLFGQKQFITLARTGFSVSTPQVELRRSNHPKTACRRTIPPFAKPRSPVNASCRRMLPGRTDFQGASAVPAGLACALGIAPRCGSQLFTSFHPGLTPTLIRRSIVCAGLIQMGARIRSLG